MKILPVVAEFDAAGRTGRQTDRHTDRQTDRQTYRQTDRHDENNSRFSQLCERSLDYLGSSPETDGGVLPEGSVTDSIESCWYFCIVLTDPVSWWGETFSQWKYSL